MHINPAYFANRVIIELAARDIDGTIESAEDCRIVVSGVTFEPQDDENPRQMAERIAQTKTQEPTVAFKDELGLPVYRGLKL